MGSRCGPTSSTSIQSTPTPPASLTGSTFPTNIKDPFSHKPHKLQDSWLHCLWRDSSTTRPSPCDKAKQQQQKQRFSVNGGYNMLGNTVSSWRPSNNEIENNNNQFLAGAGSSSVVPVSLPRDHHSINASTWQNLPLADPLLLSLSKNTIDHTYRSTIPSPVSSSTTCSSVTKISDHKRAFNNNITITPENAIPLSNPVESVYFLPCLEEPACEVSSPVSPYSYTLSSNVEHQFQNLADSNGHSDSGLLDQIISGYLPMSVSATSPASSVCIPKYFSNNNTLNCAVCVPQENYSTITPTCTGFNTSDHIMADLERFIETNYIGLYCNPEAQQQPQDQQQPPPRQGQPQQQQLEANNFNSTHFSAPYPYTDYLFSMPPISDALEEILHLTPELFDSQQYGNGYYS